MSKNLISHAGSELDAIAKAGTYKSERQIVSPQNAVIRAKAGQGPVDDQELLNLCANNYLGLANDSRLVAAAKDTLDSHGFGMASVRFIGARFRLIVTDGVFSMDGIVADLPGITRLAEQYDALVMVDDCHATGFMGARGAGTPEFHGVESDVHLLSGTFGKALGGASGGYIAGPAELVGLLRQRARPYLFSNAVAPAICSASTLAIELAAGEFGYQARVQIQSNAKRFRHGLAKAGFKLVDGQHAIIPVMIGDAALASRFADALLAEGVYVIAFSYPVVPEGTARIRTQMSAAHTDTQIDFAIDAFARVARQMGI